MDGPITLVHFLNWWAPSVFFEGFVYAFRLFVREWLCREPRRILSTPFKTLAYNKASLFLGEMREGQDNILVRERNLILSSFQLFHFLLCFHCYLKLLS